MPLIASAASQAADKIGGQIAGGLQLFKGLKDEKRAKAELAALTPAFYEIQDEYLQNRNQAASMAQTGTPQESMDFMTTEAGRGLGTSLSAILQGGASPNDVSQLLGTYDRSINRIGAQDAEQRLRNIQYFTNANKDLAAQKTMQWTINEFQPYQNKLKELTQRRAAAEQNKFGGLGTLIGANSAANKGMSNEGLMAGLFDKQQDPFPVVSGNTAGMNTVPMTSTVNSPAATLGNTPAVGSEGYWADPAYNFNFSNRPV